MKSTTPLKRDKSLVSLSKDHHDGLLLTWKTRQGIRYNIDHTRISKYIVEIFDKELQPHFHNEEVLLFSKLASSDEGRITAEAQHAAIRASIASFKTSPDADESVLLDFASLLEAHIRFEERTLFPHIEKTIPVEELQEIGTKLNEDHLHKQCVVWQDEFWLKK